MALTTIKEEPERKEAKVMYWSTLPNNPFRMMDLGFRLEFDDIEKTIKFVSLTNTKDDTDTE